MPVCEISRADAGLEPNHVYVAPRGHNVAIRGGMLGLEPVAQRGRPPLPIDSSSARSHAIKGAAPWASCSPAPERMARSASRRSAPRAASRWCRRPRRPSSTACRSARSPRRRPTSCCRRRDARASAHARRSAGRAGARSTRRSEETSSELERILAVIRLRGGHDFSAYKRETLFRRIERRMDLHRIDGLADYARYLESNDAEIDALWRDWLIGVSSFFRDPEALQALVRGFSELLATRDAGSPLRVWVPGCATGEEAYSIAIDLLETPRAARQVPRPAGVRDGSQPDRDPDRPHGALSGGHRGGRRRRAGSSASSSRRTGTIGRRSSCATPSCSRCRTCSTIRRSRAWI